MMGLQNAIITKLSGARIRTTHVTGMITDIGIEIGKLFYIDITSHDSDWHSVRADRKKLRLLALLVGLFFAGGVIGALGFKCFGFVAALFLAAVLMILAVPTVFDDVVSLHKRD